MITQYAAPAVTHLQSRRNRSRNRSRKRSRNKTTKTRRILKNGLQYAAPTGDHPNRKRKKKLSCRDFIENARAAQQTSTSTTTTKNGSWTTDFRSLFDANNAEKRPSSPRPPSSYRQRQDHAYPSSQIEHLLSYAKQTLCASEFRPSITTISRSSTPLSIKQNKKTTLQVHFLLRNSHQHAPINLIMNQKDLLGHFGIHPHKHQHSLLNPRSRKATTGFWAPAQSVTTARKIKKLSGPRESLTTTIKMTGLNQNRPAKLNRLIKMPVKQNSLKEGLTLIIKMTRSNQNTLALISIIKTQNPRKTCRICNPHHLTTLIRSPYIFHPRRILYSRIHS